MPCLGLTDEDMPLWWTADFVLTSLDGEAEQDKWVLQEFNCSCVGIKQCLAACCTNEAPFAKYTDITRDNLAEAQNIGAIIGNEVRRHLDDMEVAGRGHVLLTVGCQTEGLIPNGLLDD